MSFITFFEPVYKAAFVLLPPKMDTPEAKAMLLAIGLQESIFLHRRQINGPAKGFWQFEHGGGVRGVLYHPASQQHIKSVLTTLQYNFSVDTSYVAIEHNDILAMCYARLLLWTLPQALPRMGDEEEGWKQYLSAWRPGQPHRETWSNYFTEAWAIVEKNLI